MGNGFLEEIKRLKAIADIGLLYNDNPFDQERYQELQDISYRLLNSVSGHELDILRESFPAAKDYPTVKVDIRGLVMNNNQVLLVQESADGKWSLPGGWADIGYTPKEVVIKECKEEAGLDVIPKALLAVFDKRSHGHPPQAFYVYKMVFYCEAVSFELNKGFDILDVQYFDLDKLPPLSENRILKSQIDLLYNKIMAADFQTYFD